MTICLIIMSVSTTVFAEESDKDVDNQSFTVTIEYGLDGVAMEDKAMPLTVTIGNTGKDFSGTLRVVIPATYDQQSLAYEKTVAIPSGGEKSFSFLLSNVDTVSFLRVELENDRGKILYSQQHTFKSIVIGQEAVVGILSSDYSALNFFDGVSINTSSGVVTSKTIRLTAENIPETSEGLAICQYIIIDNYNTSQLSQEQRNAIANWVADGGMLIFGTGSKASTTLEGFQDSLTPMTVNGLNKQEMLIINSQYEDSKQVDIADLSVEGWQDIEMDIAWGGPAWQQGYGNGMILVLSYDLSMEPIVGWWEANDDLAKNILEHAGTSTIYDTMLYGGSSNSYDTWYLENAVGGVDRNKVPNALLYAGVFLIYVIAIGPVMYLILKAKDKREKMWIVMPLIALGFTVIVYGTSMLYRIHKPFIDAVAFVEFNNGSINTKNYITVQSPKSKAYSIEFAEGYQNLEPWADSGVDYSQVGKTDYQYSVSQEGTAVQLNVKPAMAFSRQNLMTQKEEYQQGAGFDMNLTCSMFGFEGTVTNHTGYDLTNVVVCYNDQYAFLGKMKNGDTATISKQQLGNISGLYYDLDQWMEEVPDTIVFQQSEEYKTLLDNQNIYNIMESRANSLEVNQGVVFGMIDNYDEDLVEGRNTKVYSAGIAVSYFYQVMEEYQNYSYFLGDINEYMVGGDRISYDTKYPEGFDCFYDIEDPYIYGSEMLVLYDFSMLNLQGAQLMNITDISSSYEDTSGDEDTTEDDWAYEYYGEDYAKVQLYNYETGQYEDAFVGGMVTDITPYVNESGWMQVRYYNDDPDAWDYYAPQITLVGGEQQW